MSPSSTDTPAAPRGVRRWLWFGAGWLAVVLGAIGIVLPGWPTTVFFIGAASCFARSSPRFEQWVLNLPKIGPLVRDHRAGLGMPRGAKAWAIGCMVAFGGLGAYVLRAVPVVSAVVVALVAVGVWYVGWRVPTKSRVAA